MIDAIAGYFFMRLSLCWCWLPLRDAVIQMAALVLGQTTLASPDIDEPNG